MNFFSILFFDTDVTVVRSEAFTVTSAKQLNRKRKIYIIQSIYGQNSFLAQACDEFLDEDKHFTSTNELRKHNKGAV